MVYNDVSIVFFTNKIHHSMPKGLYFSQIKSLNLGIINFAEQFPLKIAIAIGIGIGIDFVFRF
jgi:hypothetical protein